MKWLHPKALNLRVFEDSWHQPDQEKSCNKIIDMTEIPQNTCIHSSK